MTRERHEALIEALVGPHRDQWMTSALFRQTVEQLARAASDAVDLAAAGAQQISRDNAELVAAAVTEEGFRVVAEPGTPLHDAARRLQHGQTLADGDPLIHQVAVAHERAAARQRHPSNRRHLSVVDGVDDVDG